MDISFYIKLSNCNKSTSRTVSKISDLKHKEVIQALVPFKDKLYRYAFRILGNEMAAEDVLQEVFIKVWTKKDELVHIENKEAWCMTVTRNLALDKKRQTRLFAEPEEMQFKLADSEPTPFEALHTSDLMLLIKNAISELPDAQQQVVHLRDVEGYSYQEIADITGFTMDQVKVYLHRARLTLRSKLKTLRQ